MGFLVPSSLLFFLTPSMKKDASNSLVLHCEIFIIMSFLLWMIPSKFRRKYCTEICLSTEDLEHSLADDPNCPNYYQAQRFWPDLDDKYHKSHPFYRLLPEWLNPEFLEEGGKMFDSTELIRVEKESEKAAFHELAESMLLQR